MKKLRYLVVVFFALLIVAAMTAPQVHAASYWKQKTLRFAATAGETLAIGDVVCIKGSDGKAYKADADDSSLRPAVGIISKGGATLASVEITAIGILAGQTAVTPGYRIFLSNTPGVMTTTAPTNAQVLGWAQTSTTFIINIQPPSNTGGGY
jgi:hypothetical protein